MTIVRRPQGGASGNGYMEGQGPGMTGKRFKSPVRNAGKEHIKGPSHRSAAKPKNAKPAKMNRGY